MLHYNYKYHPCFHFCLVTASAATDNDASTSINLEVIDATSAADLIDGAYFVIDDPTNNIFLPNLPENPAMPQAQDSQDAQDAQDVPQAASLNESKSKSKYKNEGNKRELVQTVL